ncbi:MAG TPA: histidine kinase, partial [Bacteroidota bacterium]
GITGIIAKLGWFRRWYLVVLGGILLGIPTAGLSSLISAYVFGGVTMGAADFIVLFFRSQGFTLHESTLLQAFIMDPADKVMTFLIVFALTRNLPSRLLARFPGVRNIQSSQPDLNAP